MNIKKLNQRSSPTKKNTYFRVPLEYKPGQLIQVKTPSGSFVRVRVPDNVKGGDSFVLELEDDGKISSKEIGSCETTSPTIHDGKIIELKTYQILTKKDSDRGFERYRNCGTFFSQFYWGDLAVALWVGALVGTSIVAGFLTGILLVTDS